jgi:uncharacterized protein (DUF433 family)
MSGHPEIHERVGEETSGHLPGGDVPTSDGLDAQGPRLVHRDGMAYMEGCDIPIWQLEMSRRAGSAPTAILKVFPTLTPEGLDLAFAYAQQHREEIDALICELGPTDVPPSDEGEDDEGEIQADLDEIFEEYGEVFRRLAQ